MVLATIFQYLTTHEKICVVGLVCKRWRNIVYSSTSWKIVDLNWKRKVNVSILQKLVFPGTCTVLLSECICLYWRELYNVLKECKRLERLALSFITGPGDTIDFRGLNICHLRYIDLNNCNLTDSLFELVASS